ncbi:MAG: ribonuclease Z, partial [Bacteroidetes bacterium]|nr:ribonuclease Z [Bacteroidota bacterium]
QMQFRKYKIKFQKINHIFISHLHGDHYLGLVGLLSSFHLLGRKNDLHIYSHESLKTIIDSQLEISQTVLQYPIIFHPLEYDKSRVIFENDQMTVETVILNHRIPTVGFIFRERQLPLKIKKEVLLTEDIPVAAFDKIKKGEDFICNDGRVLKNSDITTLPAIANSYAYCSDTGYFEPIIEIIKNVDLLYHEATFAKDRNQNAIDKLHSTTEDAAHIAKKANVKRLIIGHYSARYDDLSLLLSETKNIFENSELAEDGKTFMVD